MNNIFTTSLKLQKQMFDAQQDARAKLDQAAREIAEANLEAMKAWVRVWNIWL